MISAPTMFCLVFLCWPINAQPAAQAGAAYCQIADPNNLKWSPLDTRRTKEGLDIEFRKWKRLCGSKR